MSKAESKFYSMDIDDRFYSIKRSHKTNVQDEIDQDVIKLNILIEKQNNINEELVNLRNKIQDKKMSLLTKGQLLELHRSKRYDRYRVRLPISTRNVYIDDDTDSDEDC